MTIANISNSIDNATLAITVAAIGVQVSRDLQPEWGVAGTLTSTSLALTSTQVSLDAPTEAIIYIGDSSTDPTTGVSGVYGYHRENYNHVPYGFVYLDVCAQKGEAWSCTLSHEILELLVDPSATELICGPDPSPQATSGSIVYYEKEICDPTQGDVYPINGVSVSNFVMRSYFAIAGGAPRTNFLNLGLNPFGVRPGGYFQYGDGATTNQINGSRVDAQQLAARTMLDPYRRNARRAARLVAHPNSSGTKSSKSERTNKNRHLT